MGSGDEVERVAVGGAHDCEVAVVHRRDCGDTEAFGDRDDAGHHEVEAQVLVFVAEVDAASPVVIGEVHCIEVAGPDGSEELVVSGGPSRSRPRCLRDHWDGRCEFAGVCCEQRDTFAVADRSPIGRGEPDVCVNEEHDGQAGSGGRRCARSWRSS